MPFGIEVSLLLMTSKFAVPYGVALCRLPNVSTNETYGGPWHNVVTTCVRQKAVLQSSAPFTCGAGPACFDCERDQIALSGAHQLLHNLAHEGQMCSRNLPINCARQGLGPISAGAAKKTEKYYAG